MMYVYMLMVEFRSSLSVEHVEHYFTSFIPRLEETGCFSGCSFELDVAQHCVVLRCKCSSRNEYQIYNENYSPGLFADFYAEFGCDIVSFNRRFLEVLS